MTSSIIVTLLLPLALQVTTPVPAKPATFADLLIEEATAPRCGVAFAIVQGWQEAGDARGGAWPDLKAAGAREFFLRAMVRLMDTHNLKRADVTRLVEAEHARHQSDDFADIAAMMPSCLALLQLTPAQTAN